MANCSLSSRRCQRHPVGDEETWACRWFQCFSPRGTSTKPILETVVSDSPDKIVFISEPNHCGEHILVRPEYPGIWSYIQAKRAERDVAGTHTFGGLVVWGSPGIGLFCIDFVSESLRLKSSLGKTSLLSYLLAFALSEEVFVAWCISSQHIIVFAPGEPPYMILAADFSLANLPRNALVLCDSAHDNKAPPEAFVHPSAHVFVVQATSPTESRYRGWAKDKEAELWPMDLWTGKEFQKLM